MRVVLDGSAINELLDVGSVGIMDLAGVVGRFRQSKIAMQADIQKAYLMIEIRPADREFLKIVHPDGMVSRFARLPFGLSCSAGLLQQVLDHHLNRQTDRQLAQIIREGLYVDDLLIGADNEEKCLEIRRKSEEIFAAAGMNLHKFAGRSWNEGLPDKDSTSVLGLQ